MKRLFFKAAKNIGAVITEYSSKRSDMGVQHFDMKVLFSDGRLVSHSDGYFVGEANGREKIIDYFKTVFLVKRF